MYGTSAVVPTVPLVHVDAAGARPPVVFVRWMNVVAVSRSPSVPAGVERAERSSQSIAVGSTLTPSTRCPTTVLPSRACQVGPPKWVARRFPFASNRSARGATRPQAKPVDVGLHE